MRDPPRAEGRARIPPSRSRQREKREAPAGGKLLRKH
jgi:hypothetical protein